MPKISFDKNIVLKFYTTPTELRELADKMEKHWEESIIGDDLAVDNFNLTEEYKLKIIIDQKAVKK